MEKLETNALFFSNKNIDLAYRLKNICREVGINVVNCDSSTNLIMCQIQIKPQIIIFDLTQETSCSIDFIKSFCCKGFYFVPNVIIISNTEVVIDFNVENVTLVLHQKSFEKEIIEYINDIRMNILKCKSIKYSEELINEAILETLKPLCFNKSHSGYRYLKDSVKIIISNEGVVKGLSKIIYTAIAAINNVSVCTIERNIRTAAKFMWQYTKQENLYNIFGEIKIKKYPSNLQIIYTLAERALNYCMARIKLNQHIA